MSVVGRTPRPTALNAARRARELDALAVGGPVDVLVIGGGITGAGVALDAAARGLRTALVDKHDLAYGTSRFSSKLVHGGLRYLASGQYGIAHESAVERHRLMTRIAPHLTRPLAQVVPLFAADSAARGAYIATGYVLGDALRALARTPRRVLPDPGFVSAAEVERLAPAVRSGDLRGGVRGWDGQLFDDARLVVAVARTAAGYGASILTRVEAVSAVGDSAVLRDALTGAELTVRARTVINATGVWAGRFDAGVHVHPSRGTHLVVDAARLGFSDVSLTAPLPGSSSRFVFSVPAPHGRAYIGLTDVDAPGEPPEVASATDAEIDQLLDVFGDVLQVPLSRDDVIGTFAGLRPLLAGGDEGDDEAAEPSDLSRRHAVRVSRDGVVSIVGGKLTTYRRMAQDAVDAAARHAGLRAGTCVTASLPLVGAWPRERLAWLAPEAPARFVRRYGAEARFAAGLGAGPSAARGVTAQELEWAVRVEGALTVDDVLDRRTRLGLVAADRAESAAAVASAFDRAGVTPA